MTTENDLSNLHVFRYKDCVSENTSFVALLGNRQFAQVLCFFDSSDRILKDMFTRGTEHRSVETDRNI